MHTGVGSRGLLRMIRDDFTTQADKLVLAFPVTSVTANRSFSCLRRNSLFRFNLYFILNKDNRRKHIYCTNTTLLTILPNWNHAHKVYLKKPSTHAVYVRVLYNSITASNIKTCGLFLRQLTLIKHTCRPHPGTYMCHDTDLQILCYSLKVSKIGGWNTVCWQQGWTYEHSWCIFRLWTSIILATNHFSDLHPRSLRRGLGQG